MSLNDIARRYADELFNRKMEEILRLRQKTLVEVNQDHSQRNMLQSGMYLAAMARVGVDTVRMLAEAKMDTLLRA